MQKLIEYIFRPTNKIPRDLWFHNYKSDHKSDQFEPSISLRSPDCSSTRSIFSSVPRRSTFQETIHSPRPLLDVPRDVSEVARRTEVDLQVLPPPPSCPNWNTPPPLRGHSSPNRCCIPKKPRSHCATNRKSSVGLRAGRLEKFHRQAL